MQEEGKVLAVLVAPQMQHVADVAAYRRCVPWRTYFPRVSAPQVLGATLFGALITMGLIIGWTTT
jgi:hypothetical protein